MGSAENPLLMRVFEFREGHKILIIGGGNAGTCAAKVCAGMGGFVEIFDTSLKRLQYLDDILPKNVKLSYFSNYELLEAMKNVDVIIETVYNPGAKTPKIITKDMIKLYYLSLVFTV